MTKNEIGKLQSLGCEVYEAVHCHDDSDWNKLEIAYKGILVGSELVAFNDVIREMGKVLDKVCGDYMPKRKVMLDGFIPTQSNAGLYTIEVMNVSNCVVEFTNMTQAQMVILWHSFEADENIKSYVMVEY